MSNDRLAEVYDLISLTKPVEDLSVNLANFEWDFDGVPAVLSKFNVESVLRRYIGGELTSEEVEKWSNLVEGREDICYQDEYKELISSTIHELANPVLFFSFNINRAREILNQYTNI